ncbi:hypothetical protein CAPTEDRAFT_220951 [Capitella teleta]|uniref:CUE domain-containing protein n=1 Tax=Capitella teleta TaxID=283909 RepID=R7U566_CAPTE|nr:hypothetical protein CAPTEDRAFT_220951 [Capitella teleta]|eukprot:ELT98811.1 hypothetical protein CAPTEDRAFT_220951 [Capitella teleta]
MAGSPQGHFAHPPVGLHAEDEANQQLDFNQAMRDFKHMFPTMDEDIIEAVLRSNQGAVDATIDQLLTMSIDDEDNESPVLAPVKLPTKPRSSPSVLENTLPSYPPPSYSDFTDGTSQTPASEPSKSKGVNLLDAPIDDLIAMGSTSSDEAPPLPPKGQPPLPERQRAKRYTHRWNPPLLGNLPDDFLRIGPVSQQQQHLPMLARSPRTPSPRPLRTSGELSSEMLQQKLADNERRRRTPRGEDAQMLEDERLALMLQNEEFLMELMHDEDFMRTLQRDRMNATAFEPATSVEPDLDPDRPRPDNNDDDDDELITDGLQQMNQDCILDSCMLRDQLQGYGDDRDKYMGPFPFDRNCENAEFRQQLNNMGGSSRKKFAAAAKRFFSRKKKKVMKPTYPSNEKDGYNSFDNYDAYIFVFVFFSAFHGGHLGFDSLFLGATRLHIHVASCRFFPVLASQMVTKPASPNQQTRPLMLIL